MRKAIGVRDVIYAGTLLSAVWGIGCRPPPAGSGAPVTLKIGTSLPVDTRLGTGVPALVDSLVTEPLVTIAWDGRPAERLAQTWEALPDHLGLRLRLHDGVRFHDGTELTNDRAADILRRRIRESGDGLSYSSITSIEPDGSNAILIRTRRPESFLLTDLANTTLTLDNKRTVGTGPFAVATVDPAIQLRAFDGHYRGRPAVDQIAIHSYQTPRGAWAAMMRGEINMLHEVSREAADFVEAESSVQTHDFLRPYYISLVLNVRHPVLGHVVVRRALSEAVDRTAIVAGAMRGRGLPAEGPIWPNHWAYASAQKVYSYNPDVAKLRLDNAGFPLEQPTGRRLMPARFRFKCLLLGDSRFERIALVLQKQLYEIGVDMALEPLTLMELGSRLGRGDFDAFMFELTSGRSLSWVYRFWHSPGPDNPPPFDSGYRGADAVLDRLRAASSDADTRAAVSDLQRTLYEDPPAVFLAWPRMSRAVSTGFEIPTSVPDIMGSIRDWRFNPSAPQSR